jgi:hypothetical protein
LLSIEADLSKRGIGLVALSMGGERLDTRNPTSKLMLTILAGVATWEREIMLERQREGIAKAKAAGKYKGRPISIATGGRSSGCQASWVLPQSPRSSASPAAVSTARWRHSGNAPIHLGASSREPAKGDARPGRVTTISARRHPPSQ